jgi:hypothetical protein
MSRGGRVGENGCLLVGLNGSVAAFRPWRPGYARSDNKLAQQPSTGKFSNVAVTIQTASFEFALQQV